MVSNDLESNPSWSLWSLWCNPILQLSSRSSSGRTAESRDCNPKRRLNHAENSAGYNSREFYCYAVGHHCRHVKYILHLVYAGQRAQDRNAATRQRSSAF